MFIFAPGAGCTGACKLVQPGDELISSSTWDWDQCSLTQMSGTPPDPDQNAASTCPHANGATIREFKRLLTENALLDLTHKNFSPETLKKVKWVRKMYQDWRTYRHSLGLEHIYCDLENQATINADSLHFALCRFLTEVKKLDGSDYPGRTLYDIVICVQFHLECLGYSYKLISEDGFRDIKFTLDNLMKQRTSAGLGIQVWKAQVLSSTDEDYLWTLGLLGDKTPDQLLNTLIFCMGKGFALRAGQEHRALHGLQFNSQLKFMWDSDGEIFLRYTEDVGLETNKGGLRHRKVEPKIVDLFASDRPEHCPLHIIIRYLSLLPKFKTCKAFYLQPRKNSLGSPGLPIAQLVSTDSGTLSRTCVQKLSYLDSTVNTP